MTKPRVRFAPSPTGYLHIGGVRTALFNWLWARKTGGSFVLRIEDTDQERSTEASRAVILESMKWLGLDWDEGPSESVDAHEKGAYGPYSQMKRLSVYSEWAEKLIASGHAYRCFCTKAELDAQREALRRRDPSAGFKYPGTCRDRKDQPAERYVVRFRTDTTGAITYRDKVFGEVVTPNIELQDFVLLRPDGVPLYNFGAVVDDITMDITLVARGRDHMINTPPQIMLYEAFGARVPEFAHLPMMLAPNGEKLSKRHGAVSVAEYRDAGYVPGAILNYLARFGWSHGDQEVFSVDELIAAFDWSHVGRGDGKFDPNKFLAINYEHLKSQSLISEDVYAQRLLPFVHARGLRHVSGGDITKALYTIRERAHTLLEAADMLDPFFRDPPKMDERAARKALVPKLATRLHGLSELLAEQHDWSEGSIRTSIEVWLQEQDIGLKDIGQAARVALTGRSASPSLFDVLFILGRETSVRRLERGALLALEQKGNS